MDLSTVRSKLENWKYRRNLPDDFARDIRLIWRNCKVCFHIYHEFRSAAMQCVYVLIRMLTYCFSSN
jgi:Bromodomain